MHRNHYQLQLTIVGRSTWHHELLLTNNHALQYLRAIQKIVPKLNPHPRGQILLERQWSGSKRVTQCPNMEITIKRARMNTTMMTSANERRVNDNWTFTRQYELLMIDERWRVAKRASTITHPHLEIKQKNRFLTNTKLPTTHPNPWMS